MSAIPPSTPNDAEHSLFRRIADGVASESEFMELEGRLRTDAALRSRYVLFMSLEADLYEELASASVIVPAEQSQSTPTLHRRRERTRLIVVSALFAMLGMVVGHFFPSAPNRHAEKNVGPVAKSDSPADSSVDPVAPPLDKGLVFFTEESSAEPLSNVAIVTHANRSTDTQDPNWLHKGQRLRPGTLTIPDGEVQLDFVNGAQILIQGPASLKIHSALAATLIEGKAATKVPDSARGFVLNAPGAAVVDLGTEFVVNVDKEGRSDVLVTDGEVEVSLLGQDGNTVKSERLRDNQAVRITQENASLEATTMTSADELFIPIRATPELVVNRVYVDTVKADRPFAYWRFEQIESRLVKNEMGDDSPAFLRSQEQTPSIQVANGIATFQSSKQPRHLSVESGLPGWNRDSFTIELWACPQRLHHGAMIDILNEDWTGDLNTIEIAMQNQLIHRPGALRFFHRHPPGQNAKSGINLFDHDTCTPGQWSHVVTSKTPDSLTMYVNGNKVRHIEGKTGSDNDLYQISIGQMDKDSLHRQYEGALDEIALYDYALTPEQVRKHYLLMMSPEEQP
ncbi:LamG-like jellyroll fold domain-containing protein [Planctomicrobium sp. SH527]|uniref:LamG-like jellyroll fold domain-containing protein n=1 Tax=Planctomicrobium sp. SH527 TaxID=3448123 RepID=UPI003F5B5BFD